MEEVNTNEEKRKVGEEEHPRNRINLNPVRRFFERTIYHPKRHLQPYVAEGQVVADLGCETRYYTLALAKSVGPDRPITYVGWAEWKRMLGGFTVERRGGFVQPWALVSVKVPVA